MKNILLFTWLFSLNLLCSSAMFAQNIVLLNGSNPPVTDSCTGRLYDDGGFGNYDNTINETFTMMPTGNGCVQFNLDTLDIRGNAIFTIFSGATATGTPMATLTAINNSNISRQYFSEGAITVRFVANITGVTGSGFVARWSCAANCVTLSPCNATVYDAGGANGDYLPNQTAVNTYCPNEPNRRIRLAFSAVDVVAGDNLCVYDSSAMAGNPMFCMNNANGNGPGATYITQASGANASGCLTVVLTSDAIAQGTGFVGQISCVKPCQTIVPQLLLNTTAPNYPTVAGDSAINICANQTVTVSAAATYPQNNTLYAQTDSTSLYWFDWDDGSPLIPMNGTTHTATHVYRGGGIFKARVRVSDPDSLCATESATFLRVRVLPRPFYTINALPDICVGSVAQLSLGTSAANIAYTLPTALYTQNARFGTSNDTTFCIPDYPGGVLTPINIPITVSGLNGNTINSSSIKYVYINVQHSYMGDLDIRLVCPNGRSVEIKSQSVNSGLGTFLGIANDNFSACTEAGQGMYYAWLGSNTTTPPPFIPMQALTYNCPLGTPNTYTMGFYPNEIIGQNALNAQVLCNPYIVNNTIKTQNPGFYLPFNSLDSLNNCPINGNWRLQLTDHLGADNGIVYEWGIVFDESLTNTTETYPLQVTQTAWHCAPTTVGPPCVNGLSPNTMQVQPMQAGNYTYLTHLQVQNFPQCNSDTAIVLHVNPLPTLSSIPYTTICSSQPIVLNINHSCVGINTYMANGHSITINTSGSASPFPDTINVNIPSLCNYKVGSVQLNGLSHTFPSDIDMWLVAPNGQAVVLMSDVGGLSSITSRNYTIQDGAPAFTGITPSSSTYSPTDITPGDAGVPANATTTLSSFTGNMNGTWRLHIIDDAGGDGGSLASWSINFVKITNNHTYLWNTGSTTGAINIAPTTTTTYTVTVVSNATGCSNTASTTVTVDANAMGIGVTATPNTTSMPNGTATATLYCINDAVTYFWSNGATTPMISGLAAGTYTVTVTTAGGSTFTATTTVGSFINTQNANQNINDFTLQPNPTSGALTLNATFDAPTASVVQLQNTVGQVLLIQKNAADTKLQTALDLSHLPAGVYFVALSTTNGMQTRRIVVAR